MGRGREILKSCGCWYLLTCNQRTAAAKVWFSIRCNLSVPRIVHPEAGGGAAFTVSIGAWAPTTIVPTYSYTISWSIATNWKAFDGPTPVHGAPNEEKFTQKLVKSRASHLDNNNKTHKQTRILYAQRNFAIAKIKSEWSLHVTYIIYGWNIYAFCPYHTAHYLPWWPVRVIRWRNCTYAIDKPYIRVSLNAKYSLFNIYINCGWDV